MLQLPRPPVVVSLHATIQDTHKHTHTHANMHRHTYMWSKHDHTNITNKYKNNNFVPILYYFVPKYDIIGSMLMSVRVCNLTVGDKL